MFRRSLSLWLLSLCVASLLMSIAWSSPAPAIRLVTEEEGATLWGGADGGCGNYAMVDLCPLSGSQCVSWIQGYTKSEDGAYQNQKGVNVKACGGTCGGVWRGLTSCNPY